MVTIILLWSPLLRVPFSLRAANAKFVRRFGFIEAELAKSGRTPDQSTLEEMDRLWDAAKAAEKAGSSS